MELAGILLSSSARALHSALLCPWMRGLLGWSTVTRSPWSMLSSALLLSFDACQCLSRRMFVSFCNVCCTGMVSPVSSRSLFSPACQCPRSAHTRHRREDVTASTATSLLSGLSSRRGQEEEARAAGIDGQPMVSGILKGKARGCGPLGEARGRSGTAHGPEQHYRLTGELPQSPAAKALAEEEMRIKKSIQRLEVTLRVREERVQRKALRMKQLHHHAQHQLQASPQSSAPTVLEAAASAAAAAPTATTSHCERGGRAGDAARGVEGDDEEWREMLRESALDTAHERGVAKWRQGETRVDSQLSGAAGKESEGAGAAVFDSLDSDSHNRGPRKGEVRRALVLGDGGNGHPTTNAVVKTKPCIRTLANMGVGGQTVATLSPGKGGGSVGAGKGKADGGARGAKGEGGGRIIMSEAAREMLLW